MTQLEYIRLVLQVAPETLQDFFDTREIEGLGTCGLMWMAFTIGLLVGIDRNGDYKYRYCYKRLADAREALALWDGKDHPPGPWIVRKGHSAGEIRRIVDEYD